MTNFRYNLRSTNKKNKLRSDSVDLLEKNETFSSCVSSSHSSLKFSNNKDKILNNLFNYGSEENSMLDMLRSDVKNFSKDLVDKYYSSEETVVVENTNLKQNRTTETSETGNKRPKLTFVGEVEVMCEDSDEPVSRKNISEGGRRLSILDILMNNENCLDEISDNVSEVYSSLTSSVKRFEGSNKDLEEEDTTSTTDLDSSGNQSSIKNEDSFDNVDMEMLDSSINDLSLKGELNYHCEVDNSDQYVTEDFEVKDDYKDLIKCIVDRDYFIKSNKLLNFSVISELDNLKINKLEDVLTTVNDNLHKEQSFIRRLFITNLSLILLSETSNFNISRLYQNLMDILQSFECDVSNTLRVDYSIEQFEYELEKLFSQLLDNIPNFVNYLNLQEILKLFKVFFGILGGDSQNNVVTSSSSVMTRISGICQNILKKLQIKQIKECLKLVSYKFNNFFNSSSCDYIKSSVRNDTELDDYILSKMGHNNKELCYLNVVLTIFETIFVSGCVDGFDLGSNVTHPIHNFTEDISGFKESYEVFKDSLKLFVDDIFYKDNNFDYITVFIGILLSDLMVPIHLICPFVILELVNILRDNVKDGIKISKPSKVLKKEDFRFMKSLNLLLLISNYLYKQIYNEVRNLDYVRFIKSPNNLGDIGDLNLVKTEEMCKIDISDIKNYVSFIKLLNNGNNYNLEFNHDNCNWSEVEDSKGCNGKIDPEDIFYILLNYYIIQNKISDMEGIIPFRNVFLYLDQHDHNFYNYCYNHNSIKNSEIISINNNSKIRDVIKSINWPSFLSFNDYFIDKYTQLNRDINGNKKPKIHNLHSNVYKIHIYYILHNVFHEVLDIVMNVVTNKNDNKTLKICIDFIVRIVDSNLGYLLNNKFKTFLMECLEDNNVGVRYGVLQVYIQFLYKYYLGFFNCNNNKINYMEQFMDHEVMSKMFECINDLNPKIKVTIIKLLHIYLHNKVLNWIQRGSCNEIKSIKEEITYIKDENDIKDDNKINILKEFNEILTKFESINVKNENFNVKNCYYNLLTSLIFLYIPSIIGTNNNFVNNDIMYNSERGKKNENNIKHECNNNKDEKGLNKEIGIWLEVIDIMLYKLKLYKFNMIFVLIKYYNDYYNIVSNPLDYIPSIYGDFDGYNINKTPITIYTNKVEVKEIIKKWLNNIFNIFLLIRSFYLGGHFEDYVNFKEDGMIYDSRRIPNLWEILNLYKIFVEIYPNLYIQNIKYFLPYLKPIDNHSESSDKYIESYEHLTKYKKNNREDKNEINLIVLIINLLIVLFRYYYSSISLYPDNKSDDRKSDTNNRFLNKSTTEDNELELVRDTVNCYMNKMLHYYLNYPIIIKSILNLLTYTNPIQVQQIYNQISRYLYSVVDNNSKVCNINTNTDGINTNNNPKLPKTLKKGSVINGIKILEYNKNNDTDNRNIISLDNSDNVELVEKLSWILSCICEYNPINLDILNLFIKLYNKYNNLTSKIIKMIKNIKINQNSDIFVKCICNYLNNINNLKNVDSNRLQQLLTYVYNIINNSECINLTKDPKPILKSKSIRKGDNIIILNQLLILYNFLSDPNTFDDPFYLNGLSLVTNHVTLTKTSENVKDTKIEKNTKELIKILFIIIQKFLPNFVQVIKSLNLTTLSLNYTDSITDVGTDTGLIGGLVGTEEVVQVQNIINLIIINKLTNYEDLITFLFVQLIDDNLYIKTLTEYNLRLIMKDDLNLFLYKLNPCFNCLNECIIRILCTYKNEKNTNKNKINSGKKTPKDKPENITKEYIQIKIDNLVNLILKFYIEMIQIKFSDFKIFVNLILTQINIILTDPKISIINSLINHYSGRVESGTNEREDEELVEVVLEIYINLMCDILEGITLKNKREVTFVIKKINDVLNETQNIEKKYKKIRNKTKIRLRKILNRIKNINK